MPATYEPIATTTVSGSSTTSISFSSISSTYTDLVLILNVKASSADQANYMRFNGDSGTNYSRTILGGSGSSAFSGRNTTSTQIDVLYFGTQFTNAIVNINNYSNANIFKQVISRGNGLEVAAIAGQWRNTNAINQVSVTISGGNYVAGSIFTLYGIKAA